MKNDLDKFINLLEIGDPADDEVFCKILATSEKALNMSDQDLGRAIRVSRPTVTRWRNGKSVPHPLVRKGVIDFLKERSIQMKKVENDNSRN